MPFVEMAMGAALTLMSFALTCFCAQYLATDGFLWGAPIWAWGLASAVGVGGILGSQGGSRAEG